MSYYQSVYDIVRQVPRGYVATYGQIADLSGNCTARMVGYALSALDDGARIPWHRVINRYGEISLRSRDAAIVDQRQLLEAEGVEFNDNGRVDLNRFRWHF